MKNDYNRNNYFVFQLKNECTNCDPSGSQKNYVAHARNKSAKQTYQVALRVTKNNKIKKMIALKKLHQHM